MQKALEEAEKALATCGIPYEGLLMDPKSRKWIAPKIWDAIEAATFDIRAALARIAALKRGEPPSSEKRKYFLDHHDDEIKNSGAV